jgi:hypothetical protein
MNIGTPLNGVILTGQWADAANGVASPGDPIKGYFVEYSPVPLPPALLLFGTGLGGLAVFGFRRKTNYQAN